MGKVKDSLLRLFFPPKCMFCRGVTGGALICSACRRTMPDPPGKREGTGYFSSAVSAVRYEGAFREAAIAMKFHGRREYAAGFAELLAPVVEREYAGAYDVLTWAPVSRERLKERGYDQSALIAARLAELLGTTARPLLEKVRDNPAQSGIDDAESRRRNVRDAYAVKDRDAVRGKRVLLVDDILTTGATLNECARTLLMAGAEDVLAAAPLLAKRGNDG